MTISKLDTKGHSEQSLYRYIISTHFKKTEKKNLNRKSLNKGLCILDDENDKALGFYTFGKPILICIQI